MGGSRLHVCGVLRHQSDIGAVLGDIGAVLGDIGAVLGDIGAVLGDIGAVLGDIGAVCAGGDENDIMKFFDMSASRGDVCQPGGCLPAGGMSASP